MGIGSTLASLFGGGKAIPDTVKSVGTLAKDIRDSFTGEGAKLEASELENKALELAQQVDLALIDVSKVEARGNWLQRSWRPLLAYSCILVIFVQYFLQPIMAWIKPEIGAPALNAADLWPIILALIGYRTYEKQQTLT